MVRKIQRKMYISLKTNYMYIDIVRAAFRIVGLKIMFAFRDCIHKVFGLSQLATTKFEKGIHCKMYEGFHMLNIGKILSPLIRAPQLCCGRLIVISLSVRP